MQSLLKEKVSLLELWEERKGQFEQCMELQLFLRDAFQAENWMAKQEVRSLLGRPIIMVNLHSWSETLPGRIEKCPTHTVFSPEESSVKNTTSSSKK